MLARALPALAIAAAVAVGCGDLFHGTDWSTKCDADPAAPGCAVGGGGGHPSTSHHASSGASMGHGGGGAGGSSSTSPASVSASNASTSGTGGTSLAGCSDGTREGFVDLNAHPTIAACSGGFSVPGVATAPSCGRDSGNDGTNPSGVGCSAGDLCAAGWHVCTGPGDVSTHSSNGCTDASGSTASVFFVTQASGAGSAMCNSGANDIFGCGNLGTAPDVLTCAPLDRFSGDLCMALGAPWNCGIDNINEAHNVTKSGPSLGGVLCCTD